MVHGNCVSVGCYAMTDERIEEIYTLVQTAFQHGQKTIAVHAFPFEMTEQNLANYANRPELDFWKNLREGYDFFVKNTLPPRVNVKDKKYVFE
jgi:murein L,D-transpeptidase YafK